MRGLHEKTSMTATLVDIHPGVGNEVISWGPPKASRERGSEVEGEGCSWGLGCGWNRAGGRGREIRAGE